MTAHLQALTPDEVFAKAPPPEWREPTFVDPARAPVAVDCGVSPRLAQGTVYAAVRVVGRAPQAAIAPLNVSLVLDRSGSMHGEPFLNLLRAAEAFVGQLRDGDRLSIVVFSDGVFEAVPPIVVEPATRPGAIAAIRALEYGGLTRLSGGLLAGLYDVWSFFDAWNVNQLVLLSDGQPNQGITDRTRLASLAASAAERGVGITTVGFGPDHDELLMQAIADAGGGAYHYVSTAADIPAVFQREAADMLGVAARDTVVEVAAPSGWVVEDVVGQDYYVEGGRIWVRLGAVPHGEERYLVLRLRPARATAPALPIEVVGSDMALRARFGLRCQPRLHGDAGGEDRWVLELAGRAEGAWGLTEAMGWAEGGTEPFAIAQLAHTRGILAGMRDVLGGGALAEEDRALEAAQVQLAANVAAGAATAARGGGLQGLMEFGARALVNSAAAAATQATFHPLVRTAVEVSWYGRPARFLPARTQRPFKAAAGDRNRKNKAARYDAWQRMRVGRGASAPRPAPPPPPAPRPARRG
ncbi:MAG TPA: VWA domain-containing protein [Anaeromyxobacteraceae bacterium]|nr:VWA domain-containing protein [Anaeromyxobacteraceae bacterium]